MTIFGLSHLKFSIFGIVFDGYKPMKSAFKPFLILVSLFFLLSFEKDNHVVPLDNEDVYVHWMDRKLKWSDFQGDIPEGSNFDALTHSAISLDFQGEGVLLEFNIEAIFDPTKSWKRESVNDYILNHEQIHFDITEYHARLLRKKLKTTRYKSYDTVAEEVKEMFNIAYDEANEMQVLYDNQTNHSINKKKQNKWNKKMKKMLKSTSSYKNPKLKVNVSYLTE